MNTLKSMLSPLSNTTNALQDTLKLVVIGGTVETARRVSVSAWNGFVDSFFLTAHFSQDDYPYDWLMHWLAKQPAWGRSREFEITTRAITRNGLISNSAGDIEEDEDEEEGGDTGLVHGKRKRKVQFMPSIDTTHTIYYRGHWLRITRTKRYPDDGHGTGLKISVVARSNDILKKLVLEAKRDYEKDAEHRVHIFLADTTYACWRWNGARQKRPMSSIVLQPGVKEMLMNDCKDFLASEDWYAERGIPFRRGYLLHGVPGSGKTSLIHSLAGELGLDIYVVSLSAKGMSDNTLTKLMGHVPTRCILLLEDLDAAFTRGISRDEKSTGVPTASEKKEESSDGSTLSLSGLLNSLDGVAAAEGRLLFATTNHIERLDPALSRPGRMDVWINFSNATKWQAEGIFKCFFPYKASNASNVKVIDTSQKNLPGSKRKASTHSGPLLTEEEILELAKAFAEAIPEDELSVASLQGYLLKNKIRPRESVQEVGAWIIQERETREKLKKEKAEREAKEKKEAEEKKVKKEKEEKEAKEKEEKEKDAKEKEVKEKEKQERKEKKAKKAAAAATVAAAVAAAAAASPKSDTSKSESSSSGTSTAVESSTSSSESETSTGADADAEESATSEEEVEDSDSSKSKSSEKKEKWVSVKTTTSTSTSTTESEAASTS